MYGQKNYQDHVGNGPYTIAQIGCFVTAFANLLQKFGTNIDPSALNKLFKERGAYLDIGDGAGVRDGLGWQSVAAAKPSIHTALVNNSARGGWPNTNNAIVKFAFKSPTTGTPTTHFCLVADPQAHTIIDSYDGVIRSPGYYGNPVAFATYADVQPQVVNVSPSSTPPPVPSSPGSTYTMVKGDTIWSIAQRFGYTAAELMEHNAISSEQARQLPVGYVVHLPIAIVASNDDPIAYEVLPTPKQMHISRPGGAEKWSFAGVKTWKDFTSSGHFPQNTNVDIYAVATVPVGADKAAYYMDKIALGDYVNTGRPAYTIGYNWSDLSDGHIEVASEAAPTGPAVHVVAKGETLWGIATAHNTTYQYLAQINNIPDPRLIYPGQLIKLSPLVTSAPATAATASAPQTAEAPALQVVAADNTWKATYKAFEQPINYVSEETITVKDLAGQRPDRTLLKNQDVVIAGTFTKDDVVYGRPAGAVKNGLWFGIPMGDLKLESDVYNTNVDLETKAALHTLTLSEQFWVSMAKYASLFTKGFSHFKKQK